MLKINLKDVMSAVISAVLVALVGYLSTVTNIYDIDLKNLLNIAFLTAVTSLLKALVTSNDGKFGGIISIK